jgi:hypothetical protein
MGVSCDASALLLVVDDELNLPSRVQAELLEDVLGVPFSGSATDTKQFRDLVVRSSRCEEPGYFKLAASQPRAMVYRCAPERGFLWSR